MLVALVTAGPPSDLPDELATCLHAATAANTSHDIKRQRALLEHAESLTGRPEDAAEVQRQLAVLDWKYKRRDGDARARLARATEGHEPGKAWLALHRLETERGRFEPARDAAQQALRVGMTVEVRREARIAAAQAVSSAAARARRGGADEARLRPALRAARDTLREIVSDEFGLLPPSQSLLEAAVLLGDGPTAWWAWRSYYHVGEDAAAPNAVADAGAVLRSLLPRLGHDGLSADAHHELVDALRRTHFHAAAESLALDPDRPAAWRDDPRVRDALAYAAFARTLRAGVDEYYRMRVMRRSKRHELDALVREAVEALHHAVDAPGSPPSTEQGRFDWLRARFGVDGRLGITATFYDLHLGHIVIDEQRTITQYGESGPLRFVALDHLVSNGFQSWAWETGAQHGGWAGVDTMWQVRPAYADGAINAWRELNDPEARAAFFAMIERESARDEERARRDPVTYLPALGARLRVQAIEAQLAELDTRGLTGDARRAAFIDDMTQAFLEHSIYAHEGRHAIDRRLGSFSAPTLEYRAKLSQVVFAPQPRLALTSILSPNIGDDSPHGQANERALKNLVKWIKRHGDEIEGLDRRRPLLPQLDKLSDAQMRAAFRSMDPLARKGD